MKKLLLILLLIFIMSCEDSSHKRNQTTGIIQEMRRVNSICYGRVTFKKSNPRRMDMAEVWFELPCSYNVRDTLKLQPK